VRPSLSQDIYGRPLRDLRGPEGWILAGILRGAEIVVPRGDTVLWPGQAVYGVGRAETVTEFLSSLGVNGRPTRRVVIVGAGHVGSWLARLLVKAKIEVTVIQRGHQRAFDLASEVPEALVLQGDATEPAMLREAGIEEADYFVATTQDDEANVISSFLARELGARAVVALYQRAEFLNVLRAARVDLPLSPRLVTAGTILRMVHRREILSLDLVESGEAEVVEFQVPAKARVLRAPLQDLRFPHGAIVGAVVRGEDIFVPGGRFTFREGDRVLVFTLAATLPELERLFRGR
jgi:trk system potassium uptake protein TrkA